MLKTKKIASVLLIGSIITSSGTVFAQESYIDSPELPAISYELNFEDFEQNTFLEIYDVDEYKIYDELNEDYRVILQLDMDGNLLFTYKTNYEDTYQKGEIQIDSNSATVTDNDLYELSQQIFNEPTETYESLYIVGTPPERATVSLAQAKKYMQDLGDYRPATSSSGRFLGSVTRSGVTARVTEYVDFDAWQVGYINYNAGTLLLDIATSIGDSVSSVMNVIKHTAGFTASVAGTVGHYRGENISTKIVTLSATSGTWYNAGITSRYKVTIGNKSFSADTPYHHAHSDYFQSFSYFANKGLDGYFDR